MQRLGALVCVQADFAQLMCIFEAGDFRSHGIHLFLFKYLIINNKKSSDFM
jgi:hypothetical protein